MTGSVQLEDLAVNSEKSGASLTSHRTPIRAPKANAFAERWVRTARHECLDWTLILGRRHLERVLKEFVDHYKRQRPHRRLELDTPERKRDPAPGTGEKVRRRDRLGGLIHEYYRAAA